MWRIVRAGLGAALLGSLVVGCGGGSNHAALVDIGAGLKGLSGLSATVVAKGLPHVAALAEDDHGHVFASTASYQDDGTDTVVVFPAKGGPPVTAISGLHTPLGLLWHGGGLFVASKERIDAYGSFDGHAFAAPRLVLQLPSGVGEVNGLALGPDGRLVVGISAPCDHCTPTLPQSGAVVSVGTDGSSPTVVASGIRAPVGLAYEPGTSDLFVSMNQRDDLGAKTPGDWLGIVSSGQDWGFPGCYGQATPACAKAPHPVAALDAHAAVSGVAFVTATGSGQVGHVTGKTVLVAEWAKATVKAVHLTGQGTHRTGTVTTFLTGLKNPVPVLTEPDGTVLVGDWGSGKVFAITSS